MIGQNIVTIAHRCYDENNNDIYKYFAVKATFFKRKAPKVLTSEINTNSNTLSVYINDDNFVDTQEFTRCKNSSKWTIESNDYIIIGNSKDIKQGYKVVDVAVFTNVNSKLSHIEITAE